MPGGFLRQTADSAIYRHTEHTLLDTSTHFSPLGTGQASVSHKCHTYLVVLETGGLGEAVELGLVGVAEAGLEAREKLKYVYKCTVLYGIQ